jgi:hypothetical protein
MDLLCSYLKAVLGNIMRNIHSFFVSLLFMQLLPFPLALQAQDYGYRLRPWVLPGADNLDSDFQFRYVNTDTVTTSNSHSVAFVASGWSKDATDLTFENELSGVELKTAWLDPGKSTDDWYDAMEIIATNEGPEKAGIIQLTNDSG